MDDASSKPHRRPRGLPREAVARPSSEPGGGTEFWVGDRRVARVHYHDTGAIEWEMRFDAEGHLHGVERYEHEDGRTKWRARWVHGLQHGLQQQWDEEGRLLVETRFVRGTGSDLWWGSRRLSEQREFVDGKRQGVERWWRNRREVWWESQWSEGQQHGIERMWNRAGRLCRGYPRYFVRGEQVPRRAYEKARQGDPTLPAIDAREARPRRALPAEARGGAKKRA